MIKLLKSVIKLAVTGLIVFLAGCAIVNEAPEVSDKVAPHPGTKMLKMNVSRSAYQKALDTGSNKIRLVEVFNRNAYNGMLEHRFFDIVDNSVYHLLGIKNLDILARANGYAITDPARFWDYVLLLPDAEKAFIEIRRNGVPYLIEYKFVD